MTTFLPEDFMWWITAVDLPAMAGLFWMIWRTRIQSDEAINHVQKVQSCRSDQLREALSAFKLEVAKTYASQTDLRDIENRLVGHLLRIESKLDRTALKTAALKTNERS